MDDPGVDKGAGGGVRPPRSRGTPKRGRFSAQSTGKNFEESPGSVPGSDEILEGPADPQDRPESPWQVRASDPPPSASRKEGDPPPHNF